jgi:ParB-like chromosome segregation protein Spo0J
MSAATIPMPQSASSPKATRRRRQWSPSDRERLAYRWHKHQGLTQEEVGGRLGVHQTTISRMVRRVESWEARLRQTPEGRLELQHARRWSTMDQNDEVIRMCFRQVDELQYGKDYSTSRLHKPAGDPCAPMDVVTENGVRDYSGVIVRFLALAFRVNMQQLRISEMKPLADLPELSDEEIDAQIAESEALEAEIAAHERQLSQKSLWPKWKPEEPAAPVEPASSLAPHAAAMAATAVSPPAVVRGEPQPPAVERASSLAPPATSPAALATASPAAAKPLNLHKTHNDGYVPSHVLSRMKLPYVSQRDLERMFPSTPEKPSAKAADISATPADSA